MSGFHDLVPQAQPALLGAGAGASATEGATWEWRVVDVLDNDGTPIDFTLPGVVGTCEVTDRSGALIVALDFTGESGGWVVGKDEAATVDLAAGRSVRQCMWSLRITDGTDTVQVWGAENSEFRLVGA